MKYIKCDICNEYVGDSGYQLYLRTGIIGTPKIEDLCIGCGYWLLKLLKARRNEFNISIDEVIELSKESK